MFSKHKIEQLQLALKSLELYSGKIDGIVGPLTLLAINKFEAIATDRPMVDKPEQSKIQSKPKAIKLQTDTEGADIETALIFTLRNEGGFSNHPADRGGATNKGITIGRLSEYLHRDASVEEVKNLDFDTIKLIYKKYYWNVMNLDNVYDQSIASVLFDMGVLCGTGTSAKIAQEVLDIRKTKKIDKKTLEALNETTGEEFIPQFVQKNIDRFKEIVENRPSQKVFLNGWTNRAKRLLTLVNQDDINMVTPPKLREESIGDGLYELAKQVGVPSKDIKKMIDWQTKNNPDSNPVYWVVFKIKEHSKNERMHIFNRVEKSVESVHASHGQASDPNNNGFATEFSNTPNSHKSSLGLYKTLGTYIGSHGKSLRLKGLESSNSNALSRFIVFHGANYCEESYIQRYGKCGRSWGCPAVGNSVVQDLIAKIKGGSLLLIS